jgi:hypothetical protein
MSLFKPTAARLSAAFAAALALAFAGPALAQQEQPPAQQQGPALDQETIAKAQKAQERMHEIQEKLSEIQRDTVENDPEIIQEIEGLEQRAISIMEEQGHDPQASLERLEGLQTEIQTAEDPQRRQELGEEFQQEQMKMQLAQQTLIQDESFMAAQEEVSESLLSAMRERHPETDELLAEFEVLRDEMMEMLQQQGGLQ